MFIMNGTGTEIVNTECVERFMLIRKDDAALIQAVIRGRDGIVTIGRYAEASEASRAMAELMEHLSAGESHAMYGNTGRYLPEKRQNGYHGAHSARHGGS